MGRRRSIALLALLLVATGCSIGGRSPAPQYFVLDARADAVSQPLRATIGVGPVRVAPFLHNQRIVVREGGNHLRQLELQRWAEPLDQGIQRALLQNLQTLTDTKVRNFPWRQRGTPHYAVRLDVLDLDRLADGNARLEVIWIVEDLRGERLARSRRETFTAPTADRSAAALSDAYSALVLQLAQRIATALTAEAARTAGDTPR
jgi:uncharacterized lipoprotein YmbA